LWNSPGRSDESSGCHNDPTEKETWVWQPDKGAWDVIGVDFTGRLVQIGGLSMKNKLVELPDRKYGANHHIWDNNGTWWCHLSLERRSGPAKRIRFSLRTNNVREARKRRDLMMNANEAKAKALIKSWK
jgi:hypothetical protein